MCRNSLQVVTENGEASGLGLTDRVRRFVSTYARECRGGLLLAVSGGSDSLALLHAFARLPQEKRPPLRVATVDHALRDEARAEAEFVSKVCSGLGLPHAILTLTWKDGATVSQAQARRARYGELAQHAREFGLGMIATGHTLDDQLETVFIRMGAGSGPHGLSGMADIAPVPVWPEGYDVAIARPLLGETRQTLQSFLFDHGVNWVDDPSNENTAFERVRVRRILSEQPSLAETLHQIAQSASKRRMQSAAALSDWAKEHLVFHPGGAAGFPIESFLSLNEDMRTRCMAALLTSVGGKEPMPRQEKLESIVDLSGFDAGRTLHGCLLKRSENFCLVTPEPGREANGMVLDPGLSVVWKGRTLLSVSETVDRSINIASWDQRPVPDSLNRGSLPAYDIRRSLPVILDENGDVESAPHLDKGASVCPRDLAETRFYNLLRFKAQFFTKEYRLWESFS